VVIKKTEIEETAPPHIKKPEDLPTVAKHIH
jgi:hypothetical protein